MSSGYANRCVIGKMMMTHHGDNGREDAKMAHGSSLSPLLCPEPLNVVFCESMLLACSPLYWNCCFFAPSSSSSSSSSFLLLSFIHRVLSFLSILLLFPLLPWWVKNRLNKRICPHVIICWIIFIVTRKRKKSVELENGTLGWKAHRKCSVKGFRHCSKFICRILRRITKHVREKKMSIRLEGCHHVQNMCGSHYDTLRGMVRQRTQPVCRVEGSHHDSLSQERGKKR